MFENFRKIEHVADLCVIGGGMAGWATAITAARHGAKVVLMHDRPVLGGNASSECRVHICGADRHNWAHHMRETGLLEELRMLNLARNPNSNFSIFDTLLYEMIQNEENITLLLNTTCLDATKEGDRIASVTGWELAAETVHAVNATWFCDSSGDGILAPLADAPFRMGREARSEYNESLAPEVADDKTMGHSIRYQVKRYDTPQTFTPPPWAHVYEDCEELPFALRGVSGHGVSQVGLGHWWLELGGADDTIHDTPALRDELLKIAYGVWDHIKNRCAHNRKEARYLNLEWMQFLPAKRESRRYVGAYVLHQNDLSEATPFEDTVAYGGWSMDDHDWAGFHAVRENRPATHFHKCAIPYSIPYRSLYSEAVPNLYFAGRNISATHMAMSSTRVMATCMTMGFAVGAAVGLMKEKSLALPADVMAHIKELQQRLLADDCYLPNIPITIPQATQAARLTASVGNPEAVRDGWARQIGEETHAWEAGLDAWIAYEYDTPRRVEEVAFAFDTSMEKDAQMSWSRHCIGGYMTELPEVLACEYVIETKQGGAWISHERVRGNIHRHRRHAIGKQVEGVRLRVLRFHGDVKTARLYTFLAS